MFDSKEYPKSLSEDLFETWLEAGRESKMSYEYMLVVWDDLEADYHPEYVENRSQIAKYPFGAKQEAIAQLLQYMTSFQKLEFTLPTDCQLFVVFSFFLLLEE